MRFSAKKKNDVPIIKFFKDYSIDKTMTPATFLKIYGVPEDVKL